MRPRRRSSCPCNPTSRCDAISLRFVHFHLNFTSLSFRFCSHFQHTEAGLRLYAHPGLLAAAATINGPDFCPFSESIQIKFAGLGPSVTWHQDGTTHWDKPEPEHGFNFMCQLYGSTAANGVWAVPGTHRVGQVDIKQMIDEHGDRLPGALPMVCEPGDVVIANRNVLHASFPNVSPDQRITLNMGFHKRSAVLGAKPQFDEEAICEFSTNRRHHSAPATMTGHWADGWVDADQRSRMIPLAVDARRQKYPAEAPYEFALEHPCAGKPEVYTDLDASRVITSGSNLGI